MLLLMNVQKWKQIHKGKLFLSLTECWDLFLDLGTFLKFEDMSLQMIYKWFSTNFCLCLPPVNCAIPLLNIHVHLGALLRLSENIVWRNGLLMGLLDSTSGEKFWDFHLHSWSLPSENVCLLENIFLNTHVFIWPSYSTLFWSNCV